MQRREVVRYLAWLTAGVAASACTPLRIITRSFPDEFKHDPRLVDATLASFAGAVIPGIDLGTGGDPAQALKDSRYPFAAYAQFFASDLAQRAGERYGEAFHRLTVEQRTRVISDGLGADATTRKLYRGAIYLTQIAVYAGIYGDDGCSLIDFAGRFRGGDVSYDNADSFLPTPLTTSGNFE